MGLRKKLSKNINYSIFSSALIFIVPTLIYLIDPEIDGFIYIGMMLMFTNYFIIVIGFFLMDGIKKLNSKHNNKEV